MMPRFGRSKENSRPVPAGGSFVSSKERNQTMDMLSTIKPSAMSDNDEVPSYSATSKERNWLQRCLHRGKSERFSEIIMVTPGMAQAMLVHNIGNRPITRSQVGAHVRRLKSGDFKLTHHGISFSNTGVLNDGQHRLTAIAESGCPGELQVTFGADREEFELIDQGRSRTASDMLGIRGKTYSALRASVAAAIMSVQRASRTRADAQQIAEYAMTLSSKEMEQALAVGQGLYKVCQPTAVALAHYWIAKHSKYASRLPEFFMNMKDGENLSGARLTLRNILIDRSNLMVSNGRDGNIKRAAVIIFAWNAFILKKKEKTFQQTWAEVSKLPDVV